MLYLEQFDVSFHDLNYCNSTEFNQLYAIYSQAFPMEDEREPPEAFKKIYELIDDPNIQAQFGPYREAVSTIRRGRDGEVIGGMIFGITTSAAHRTAGVLASVQGIYVFFAPNIRGQKQTRGRVPMRVIFDYFRSVARSIYGSHSETGEVVIFLECNNPLIMSEEEISADIKSSGINPLRRYRFWMRAVASQPLDFSYVQPRLRHDAEPVTCLDLFCVRESDRQISSELLRSHLYRFCSVSVLKGIDANEDADFSKMDAELQKCDTVPLLSYDSNKVSTIFSKLDADGGIVGVVS